MSMNLGIMIGIGSGNGGGGAAPIVPTQPQLISNYTRVPNAASFVATNGTRNQVRMGHDMGRVAASSIQIVSVGYRLASGSGTESNLPNAHTLRHALEIASPATTTEFLFSGASGISIAAGDTVISDAINTTLVADLHFYTRADRTVSLTTEFFPEQDVVGADAQGFVSNGGSQLANTGALNASGTTAGGTAYPAMILGIPASPLASVIFLGDSIGNRQNDSNGPTGGGYLPRAFNSVLGHVVPWHRQTTPSHTLLNANTAPKQRLLWPYVTDLVIQLGTNDIVTGVTLATMQTRFTNIANAAKAVTGPYGKPLRIHALSILPRMASSTDSYATPGNMTPATGFALGGVRDQYNSWLQSQVGTLITGYCDVSSVVEDQSNLSKWITNGTANYPTNDGTHPQSALHQLMAPVLSSYFEPFIDPLYLA